MPKAGHTLPPHPPHRKGCEMSRIRGVLFDSGDTLVYPQAGAWFPRQEFIDAFELHGIEGIDLSGLDNAIEKGKRYLNDHHHLTTEDEERDQFWMYYTIVLGELGILSPSKELVDTLMLPAEGVYMEAFPDTKSTLEALRGRGLKLGIVSDNWPSLDRRYRTLGLRDYFDAFVVSAILGCWKPCELMYTTAMDQIGLPAESLMFVDDWPANVDAAVKLGMNGVVMSRDGIRPKTDLPWVSDLRGLTALL